jgi:hypothetical protein
MTAQFFGQPEQASDPSEPDKNILLRMIDAAAEARMRKFHRAAGFVPAAVENKIDHDPVCTH